MACLQLPRDCRDGQRRSGAASAAGTCWRSGGWTRTARRIGGYRRTSDFRVSTTDPDATPMWTGPARPPRLPRPLRRRRRQGRIILAALVTPADVMENLPMRDLLWRVCFRRKLRPRQVTGDTTYGTVENIVAARGRRHPGLRPAPRLGPPHAVLRPGRVHLRSPTRDEYRCPAGPRRCAASGSSTPRAWWSTAPMRRPAMPAR